MKRGLTGGIVATLMALAPATGFAQTEQQALVDRATLSVQQMASESGPNADVRQLMQKARGALICPQIFKAGFILGGQGGDCVLVGRTGPASWSDPAFYTLGSASIGLQVGIQDTQLVLIVLTERGVRALLDTQLKLGANASLAFATLGTGVEGATSTALNADIVAFQMNRGLFMGVSLDGSLIGSRSDFNQIYYGQPLAAQQLVLGQQGRNPGAAPLKEMLNHLAVAPPPAPVPYVGSPPYGQPADPQAAYQPTPYQPGAYQPAPYPGQQQSYQQAPQYGASQGYGAPTPLGATGGGVQSAPLPPPR